MISVGGLATIVGLFTLAAAGIGSSIGSDTDGASVAGGVTIFTGLGLIGGGIPLMIYGSNRVMASENAFLAPGVTPLAPHTAVVLGAGSLRLEGNF